MMAGCALALGCGADDEPTEDTGFVVAAVVPVDGEEEVTESSNPELRVSAAADPVTCTEESVRLVGVTGAESNVVAREVDYVLSFPDIGMKIAIEPEGVLTNGYWYMVTVRSGAWGCTDTHGRVIAPFSSRFYVP